MSTVRNWRRYFILNYSLAFIYSVLTVFLRGVSIRSYETRDIINCVMRI